MARLTEAAPPPKQTLQVQNSGGLSEALGPFGLWVGPRTGPNKRTQAEKEAYVARRLIVALVRAGDQPMPLTVEVSEDDPSLPDFVLINGSGQRWGLEVTEAGDPSYQAWLTNSEREQDSADGELFDISCTETIEEWRRVLFKKEARIQGGAYSSVLECELAIYDNTKASGFLDLKKLVEMFRQSTDAPKACKRVHIVKDMTVCLDALGQGNRSAEICPLNGVYEVDYAGWIDQQVARLRGNHERIDAGNIAEELSDLGNSQYQALRSQLTRLVMHLLKWRHQPSHRTGSWASTIDDARDKIAQIVAVSPSLKSRVELTYHEAYKAARRQAALEMGMDDISALPTEPEFGLKEVLDPDFFPDSSVDGASDSAS